MNTSIDNTIIDDINIVSANEKQLETNGMYGKYGGAFVPEVLQVQLNKLSDFFDSQVQQEEFQQEFIQLLKDYVGRPSPLYYAKNLSKHIGSKIYLKREDLNHTGSHKINNCIGQILLAKQMGAKEIIAETGAGQHGVAVATTCALLNIPCKVFMGEVDVQRQQLNVRRMELLGAEVISATQGTATLKDAVDAALNYYIEKPNAYYLLGSHVGPHPYPKMVGYFQSVIGEEAKKQIFIKENRLPDSIFACIGGGSNAIGLFSSFLSDNVKIYAAEGGGNGQLPNTAATLTFGKPTVFQGTFSYCLIDEEQNPIPSQSIAAGLDYPGVSPQHAYLNDTERASYHSITDDEAVEAFKILSRLEGIIPAIESSHAVALAIKILKDKNELAIINISGRGDKDVERDL
jgi:tryptophan synthase beta chain